MLSNKARFAFFGLVTCALSSALLLFLGMVLLLSGCASVPSPTPSALDTEAPIIPVAVTVESLAATDLSWLSWGVLVCVMAALLAYLMRSYLPFNGTTSKVLLAAAVTFAIIRYVLVIVTPFLYTTLVIAGLCTATYYALTRGPSVYASVRNAIHQWYARSRE